MGDGGPYHRQDDGTLPARHQSFTPTRSKPTFDIELPGRPLKE
jgi:hypothetical protein